MSTVIQFPDRTAERSLGEVVSAEVRALMGRHEVTQVMLAAWLGMKQASVSERLRNKARWSLEDIDRIAEGFAVHPAELMGGYATGPRPDGGEGLPILRACRDSNPKPSDPKVLPLRAVA